MTMITLTPQEELIASIRKDQIEQILKDAAGDIFRLPSWKRSLFAQLVQDQKQDLQDDSYNPLYDDMDDHSESAQH
jgi:hypothetical protein